MNTNRDSDQDTEEVLAGPLAEISQDLFGEADPATDLDPDEDPSVEGEEPEALAADAKVDPADAKEATAATDENSEAVVASGAPKTWTKEAIADWATIPPRAQQEILKREEDMMRGLEQYKESAATGKAYSAVVEPYSAALAAEGVNPVDLFKAFAGNHYLLARGTPEQKVGLVLDLLRGYNIPLDAISAAASAVAAPSWEDPAIRELRERTERMEAAERQRNEASANEHRTRVGREVETFMADPANIYLPEVGDDIAGLIKSGAAANLKDAYDLAVYRNPVTRAKELARLQAEAGAKDLAAESERTRNAMTATSVNVKTNAKARDATVPRGSMDDTLAETFARLNS